MKRGGGMRTKGILLASINIAPRLIFGLHANKVQDPEFMFHVKRIHYC